MTRVQPRCSLEPYGLGRSVAVRRRTCWDTDTGVQHAGRCGFDPLDSRRPPSIRCRTRTYTAVESVVRCCICRVIGLDLRSPYEADAWRCTHLNARQLVRQIVATETSFENSLNKLEFVSSNRNQRRIEGQANCLSCHFFWNEKIW